MTERMPPTTCPACGADVRPGDGHCWLCDAPLPTPPPRPRPDPAPAAAPAVRRRGPRIEIGTLMIVVAVFAVMLAVARGQAAIVAGLAILMVPPLLYLVLRIRRVGRGEEEPSAGERMLAGSAPAVLRAAIVAAALAALAIAASSLF